MAAGCDFFGHRRAAAALHEILAGEHTDEDHGLRHRIRRPGGRALEVAAEARRLNSDIESVKSRRPRVAISHSESSQIQKAFGR